MRTEREDGLLTWMGVLNGDNDASIRIPLVSSVTKFPFGRSNIGTPSVQGFGLCSTRVDKKDAHVFLAIAIHTYNHCVCLIALPGIWYAVLPNKEDGFCGCGEAEYLYSE